MAARALLLLAAGRGMGKLIWQRGMDGRISYPSFLPSFLLPFLGESSAASRIIHLNFGLSVLILTESGGTRTSNRNANGDFVCASYLYYFPLHVVSVASASGLRLGATAPPRLCLPTTGCRTLNCIHILLFETYETLIFTVHKCQMTIDGFLQICKSDVL